jgi:hypothetical protein
MPRFRWVLPIVRGLVTLVLVFFLVPTGSAQGVSPGASGDAEPGTIPWAEAFAAASEDIRKEAPDSKVVVARYERLLALLRGCTECRRQTYRELEQLLNYEFHDLQALHRIQETEFRDNSVSLGRLYVETCRLDQAEQVVSKSLKRGGFVERRLDLLEVLAEARLARGDVRGARRIAGRLLEETPASRDYCDRALKWLAMMGEEPLPLEKGVGIYDFPARFARVRNLERARGNDPYVSCLYSHELLQYDRRVSSKNRSGPLPAEVASLYPKGVDEPLHELALRTSNPKIRSSILLSLAFKKLMEDRKAALALVREAKGAGASRGIQVGALRQELELSSLATSEDRAEYEALSLRLIDVFPEYEAACDGCIGYWSALNHPPPEFSMRIEEWNGKCGELLNRCPDAADRWQRIGAILPVGLPESKQAYERILALHLPDAAVPPLLLRLSEAIRRSEPERSWQLEREAIRHPEYPGLSRMEVRGDSALRAEQSGDFETALFVSLLPPTRLVFGSDVLGHEEWHDPQPFLVAYYRIRAGIDPARSWDLLLSQLPETPEGGEARFFHRREYLDRVVRAAQASLREHEALVWFGNVSQRYHDALQGSTPTGAPGRSPEELHQTELLLTECIEELERTRGPHAVETSPTSSPHER